MAKTQEEMENAKKKVGLASGKPKSDQLLSSDSEDEKQKTEEGKAKPNDQNGGQTDRYHWDQTLHEVSVYWYLEPEITKKDVKVTLAHKKCKIQIKGQTVVDAEWAKEITVDESEWMISKEGKQNTLQLQLEKSAHTGRGWWPGIFKGD